MSKKNYCYEIEVEGDGKELEKILGLKENDLQYIVSNEAAGKDILRDQPIVIDTSGKDTKVEYEANAKTTNLEASNQLRTALKDKHNIPKKDADIISSVNQGLYSVPAVLYGVKIQQLQAHASKKDFAKLCSADENLGIHHTSYFIEKTHNATKLTALAGFQMRQATENLPGDKRLEFMQTIEMGSDNSIKRKIFIKSNFDMSQDDGLTSKMQNFLKEKEVKTDEVQKFMDEKYPIVLKNHSKDDKSLAKNMIGIPDLKEQLIHWNDIELVEKFNNGFKSLVEANDNKPSLINTIEKTKLNLDNIKQFTKEVTAEINFNTKVDKAFNSLAEPQRDAFEKITNDLTKLIADKKAAQQKGAKVSSEDKKRLSTKAIVDQIADDLKKATPEIKDARKIAKSLVKREAKKQDVKVSWFRTVGGKSRSEIVTHKPEFKVIVEHLIKSQSIKSAPTSFTPKNRTNKQDVQQRQ